MDVVQMSLAGVVLIIAVVIIRRLALHKLPKKTFLILWGAVVCRLLIPFSVPSRFSFFSGIDGLKRMFSDPAAFPALAETAVAYDMGNIYFSGTRHPIGAASVPVSSASSFSPMLIIWLPGMSAAALFFIVAYVKCLKEFQASLPVENDVIAAWLREHSIRRHVQIRQCDKIAAPLTYGIFRPVVLLPKTTDWTDETRLRYILAHELVHIKRFDALTKLVLACALCVHWFNPLVWVMYVLANRDIELACDETVVRTFGETTKSSYAMTLIDMEEKKSKITPLFNGFSKNPIEERIMAIMKTKKITAVGVTAALLLVGGTLTAFATSAVKADSDTASAAATENGSWSGGLTDKEREAQDRKAMAKVMKIYEPFGLTYDEKTGELFYQGEKVRDFYDEQAGVGQSMTEGSVDLYAVYEHGQLIGIQKRSQAEFDRNTAEKEQLQQEIAAERKELGVQDGAEFSYANESKGGTQSTVETGSAVVYSYTDETGETRISADGGKTWTSQQEYDKAYPKHEVVWWTYDEYKAWLEEEKKSLPSIIGSKGWNPSDGWYVWTQEKVDETIAMYERTLEDIKNGVMVSKTVDGKDDLVISSGLGEIEPTTSYSMVIDDGNGNTVNFGPYDTEEQLLAELKPYCEQQVKDGKMTQAEADEILKKANALK
ncbi:M56 family metallopeptidase [Paenibacillus macerans]|uniref:M56 family metallopeptidase n=1 Tax=Paenibacillus macerans TaxID=44252 RepID=UPI003D320765